MLFILLAAQALLAAAQYNKSDAVIDLGYARYLGDHNATSKQITYHGLYFAKPPVGPLRWKAPVPVDETPNKTTAVINATVPGPTCVQGYPFWMNPQAVTPTGSEDCLLLDVIKPDNANADSNLPVLLVIHGGGYTIGDASLGNSYTLMRHSNNSFISVSVQYRLGAYGYLGSKLFNSQGGDPNVALLDQRLALEWVQRHISKFGGDPSRVTLMGGSAGGGSVTNQMMLYGKEDRSLFQAVIISFPWWQKFLRNDQLQRQFQYVLEASNCKDLDCLRGLSTEELKNATQQSYVTGYAKNDYEYGNFYYGPYVDGDLIRGLPNEEISAGRYVKKPMLIDRDMYEGWSFTNQSLSTPEDEELDLMTTFPYATEDFRRRLDELYPRNSFNSTFWRRATWYGDFTINCPTHQLARNNAHAYKLIFNAGAQTHAATAPFLSDEIDLGLPNFNATLAGIMRDWYDSFAIHLDPNAEAWSGIPRPMWTKYDSDEQKVLMMVNQTEIALDLDANHDMTERCEFWREHSAIAQN